MIDELPLIDDADRIFREGYVAKKLSDCPYRKAPVGPYVLWIQGWHDHQRHRSMVALAAEKTACTDPLNFGWL